MNDFGGLWDEVGDHVLAAVERVGRSGWLILGSEVAAFEAALAAAVGRAHAIGCASGLDAIEIGFRASALNPGSRVLTTPLSAFASVLAIVRAGHVPVFVDVDASGLLDLDLVEEALAVDDDIRALLPVHLFGHALDLDRLASIKERHDLVLIEDCAQAIGASSRGRPVGSVGDAGALSLYPTKNLGAFGDGGAVLTDDDAVAAAARSLRDYGQSAKYVHDRLGMNSRLDEMHAAILNDALLPELARWTERRREVAARYRAGLANPRISVPVPPAGSDSVWHLFPVLVEGGERDAFRAHLDGAGIQSGIHYPVVIPDQGALAPVGARWTDRDFPMARRFAATEVSLPMHPLLTDEEIERVVVVVNEWVG